METSQIQERKQPPKSRKQKVPYRINSRKNMLIHINILTKIEDKKKILKAQGKSNLGIPIMLSADFSAETLQARREWHNIFKVMKWKNLQTRIPNKALIQIRWRNQKLYRQVEARRIQHHQTNFATNAKETSLDRKVYS